MSIVALDFDRVLHDTDNPKPGRRMGEPTDGALEAVEKLIATGHEVFVHTCMAQNEAGLIAVERWLAYYGFPPLRIETKPTADIYVDDKGFCFDIITFTSPSAWADLVEDVKDLQS